MKSEAEVVELLRDLVQLEDQLSAAEKEAFPDILDQVAAGRRLSPKQMEWVLGAAERLDLAGKRAENLFSELPPARQRAERARAASVVLPWEKGLQTRPLKPPGRV